MFRAFNGVTQAMIIKPFLPRITHEPLCFKELQIIIP
jgi:hypothetical protein